MFGEIIDHNPTGHDATPPLRATTHPELGVVVSVKEVTALVGMFGHTMGTKVAEMINEMPDDPRTDAVRATSTAYLETFVELCKGFQAIEFETRLLQDEGSEPTR